MLAGPSKYCAVVRRGTNVHAETGADKQLFTDF